MDNKNNHPSDDEKKRYDEKCKEMEKYLPFLRKIIENLKVRHSDEENNPRKNQLQKMEVLYNLLTSDERRLKLETLLKCESVLLKLHTKMEQSNYFQPDSVNSPEASTSRQAAASAHLSSTKTKANPFLVGEIVDITGPSSPPPSPTRRQPPMQPIEIPTERRSPFSINDQKIDRQQNVKKPIIVTPVAKQNVGVSGFKKTFTPCDKTTSTTNGVRNANVAGATHSPIANNLNMTKTTNIVNNSNITTSSIPTIITSANSASNSNIAALSDIDQQQQHFRNTDTTNSRYKWLRALDRYESASSSPKGQQTTSDAAYSPEESWNEFGKSSPARPTALLGRPIQVIDLSYDSPPSPRVLAAPITKTTTFNKIIYEYKKPETTIKPDKEVFSRLGEKVNVSGNYENFSINVKNDRMKTTPSKMLNVNNTPTHKLPAPPLADVLKSPPLSESDISLLMNESDESFVDAKISATPSISEIGTRRSIKPEAVATKAATKTPTATPNAPTPKTATSSPTQKIAASETKAALSNSPASSLDRVRKKFALITKNSPQYSDSPASPTNNSSQSTLTAANERIALKYNPHPRVERNGLSASAAPCNGSPAKALTPTAKTNKQKPELSTTATAAPYNVLPAINQYDPRLKKSQMTQQLPHVAKIDPRLQRRPSICSTTSTTSSSTIDRVAAPSRTRADYSSEENWDTDSETSKTSKTSTVSMSRNPHLTNQAPKSIIPHMDPRLQRKSLPPNSNAAHFQTNSNNRNATVSPQDEWHSNVRSGLQRNSLPAAVAAAHFQKKPSISPQQSWDSNHSVAAPSTNAAKALPSVRSNNSPEENWDSDPEVAPVAPSMFKPNNLNRSTSFSNSARPMQHNSMPSVTPVRPTHAVLSPIPLHPQRSPQIVTSPVPPLAAARSTKAQNAGYSSEENWDSDPEPPSKSVEAKKTSTNTPNAPTQFHDPRLSHDPTSGRNAFPTNSPLFSANLSTHNSPQQHSLHQHQKPQLPKPHYTVQHSNNSKFSAALNDQKERLKYMESKKGKPVGPARTYAEFKAAKAAAEASARAANSFSNQPKDDNQNKAAPSSVRKNLNESKEAKNKEQTDKTNVESTTKQLPAVASNLDKLYRGSNFGKSQFPKTNVNFKIPKKLKPEEKIPEITKESTFKETPNQNEPNKKLNNEQTSKSKSVLDEKLLTDKEDKGDNNAVLDLPLLVEVKSGNNDKVEAAEVTGKKADIAKDDNMQVAATSKLCIPVKKKRVRIRNRNKNRQQLLELNHKNAEEESNQTEVAEIVNDIKIVKEIGISEAKENSRVVEKDKVAVEGKVADEGKVAGKVSEEGKMAEESNEDGNVAEEGNGAEEGNVDKEAATSKLCIPVKKKRVRIRNRNKNRQLQKAVGEESSHTEIITDTDVVEIVNDITGSKEISKVVEKDNVSVNNIAADVSVADEGKDAEVNKVAEECKVEESKVAAKSNIIEQSKVAEESKTTEKTKTTVNASVNEVKKDNLIKTTKDDDIIENNDSAETGAKTADFSKDSVRDVNDAGNTSKTLKNIKFNVIENTSTEIQEIKKLIQLPQLAKLPEFLQLSPTTKTTTTFNPQRILRRRCTMISFGSAPEVDKEKIHSANALLFEDLQDAKNLQAKNEMLKLQAAARRTKNLAEIFQKTDDNCTVSTQNIITGKRRTRTTMNFNEVQRRKEVFQPAKTTPQDIKKQQEEEQKPEMHNKVLPPTKKQQSTTTPKAIKSLPNRKSLRTTRNSVEDQICAVSSTTTQSEENTSPKTRSKKVAVEEEENEPSSSAKSSNSTPTPLDEETGKQEYIESILRDMRNPNSNHELIFGLFSQILSKDKLEQMRNILTSASDEEDSNSKSATTEQTEDDLADDNIETEIDQPLRTTFKLEKQTDQKPNLKIILKRENFTLNDKRKTCLKKKRTNELDRLNADIRDMFISRGVITATGRRMCTLAAAAGVSKSDLTPNASKKGERNTSPIRIRKSKVILSPIDLNKLRRSGRTKASVEAQNIVEKSEDETSGPSVQQETTDDAASLITISPSHRKMPVLKPNTPIKLVEEEQLEKLHSKTSKQKRKLDAVQVEEILPNEEQVLQQKSNNKNLKRKLTEEKEKLADKEQLEEKEKLAQIKAKDNIALQKPCPKSKKKLIDTSNVDDAEDNDDEDDDDDEDNIQLANLRKRLKTDEHRSTTSNISPIRNTNPHWHCLSKYANWCVLCDAKNPFLARHYKQHHNNSENYSSRIAPSLLQQYKQGKLSEPMFGIKRYSNKPSTALWYYRCPFCLQHCRNMMPDWLKHFSRHTGEYAFQCSVCHWPSNKQAELNKHFVNACTNGKIVRNQFPTNKRVVKAHICHMCNFVQLNRENLEQHYVQQHGCDPECVTVLGYSINLLSVDGVELVDDKRAAELEAETVQRNTQHSMVILDDDDTNDKKENHIEHTSNKNPVTKALSKMEQSDEDQEGELDQGTPKETVLLQGKFVINMMEEDEVLHNEEDVTKMKSLELLEKVIDNAAKTAYANDNNSTQSAHEENVEKQLLPEESQATCSNIFMPTRQTTDSPSIECLTQSLRTIDQEAQQQIQQCVSRDKTNIGKESGKSTTVQMSMAERLSQRFKDIRVRVLTESDDMTNTVVDSHPLKETDNVKKTASIIATNNATTASTSSENDSANTSLTSTTCSNLIIAEDEEIDDVVSATAVPGNEAPADEDEDDANWEDIEISESAPSTNSSIISCASNISLRLAQKEKKKKAYQSLSRFYAAKTATKKAQQQKHKKKDKSQKPSPSATLSAGSSTSVTLQPNFSNIADLLPDSPCNDPMDVVPELAPLEPLQDLSDISSILEANFNAADAQSILQQMDFDMPAHGLNINADKQTDSIQDALDFVSDQQKQADILTMQQSQIINNRIQNLGFSQSVSNNLVTTTKFLCLSQNCSFLYSHESIGLESHYLSEHPNIKWNGFCFMCNDQVMLRDDENNDAFTEYSISQEMLHMLNVHVRPLECSQINQEEIHKNTQTFSEGIQQTLGNTIQESSQQETLEQTSQRNSSDSFQDTIQQTFQETSQELPAERPRIKLRRLTGDCLSSTPTSELTPQTAEAPGATDAEDSFSNITLADLLRAERRPINLPRRSEISCIPVAEQASDVMVSVTDATVATEDVQTTPLFKNIGNEFAITSVASGGSVPTGDTSNKHTTTVVVTTASPLQISSVRSLNDTDESNAIDAALLPSSGNATSTLPKIANVCSLNKRANSNASAATLWKQQLENDCLEMAKMAEESFEASRLLKIASKPTAQQQQQRRMLARTMSVDCRPRPARSPPTDKLGELLASTLNDPMGDDTPTLVAETLPVATATSGDFLITQTVSAQYESVGGAMPQLGFNINIAPMAGNVATTLASSSPSTSISLTSTPSTPQQRASFVCMGHACNYQTLVAVAMSEHLRFHEQRNFSAQRDYLRCSLCMHFADDVDSYIAHAEQQHAAQLGLVQSTQQNAISTTPSSITANVVEPCASNASGSSSSTTCALTAKIQEILKSKRTSDITDAVPAAANDSSSSKPHQSAAAYTDQSYKDKLKQAVKELVQHTGLLESKLYRCVIEGCKTVLNESTFHTHLVYHLSTLGHLNNYTYKCPHCKATYQRATGIKAHIKTHARHSYFCYLCTTSAANPSLMGKHYTDKHERIPKLYMQPLLKSVTSNDELVYYVAHGSDITPEEAHQFGEQLIAVWQQKKFASKTHFKPDEIMQLPMQPIFKNEIYCAQCLYKTKVRTNMFRHLQQHSKSAQSASSAPLTVASVDPINPVPCLQTNERHYDKMCNLASSSFVSAPATTNSNNDAVAVAKTVASHKIPYAFVSFAKRFTCGVLQCQHLTVSEENFRSHLNALHSDVIGYKCPFCKEEICKRTPLPDQILHHARFHRATLFQCEECGHVHYKKAVIEKHINDRHSTQCVDLITHERSVEFAVEGKKTVQKITGKYFRDTVLRTAALLNSKAPNGSSTTSNSSSAGAKWECDLCKHRTFTHNQMIHHCNTKHACKTQYQCVHCTFGATQLVHIMSHIDEKHPAKTREARYIFHKINSSDLEKEADTRPLWQRDDPKRVRNIRGILMENEEESAQHSKRLCLDDDDDDYYEEQQNSGDIDPLAIKPSSEPVPLPYEYGCYNCDYKCDSLAMLKNNHWQAEHNAVLQEAKPFLFRLHAKLRCAECRTFMGDYAELQKHMLNQHKTRIFIAADAKKSPTSKPNCGYCDFSYTRTDELIKHHQRFGHKPQDLKHFNGKQLQAIKQLNNASVETYSQCMLCSEIFANRMAIVAHERAQHAHEENFSFKELRNVIIYRCAMCNFTGLDELDTMRHMLDHYGKFKRCYFCNDQQNTFVGYMQHCNAEHRTEIKRFAQIYTYAELANFLRQIFFIFPNGLVVNKKNLAATLNGSDAPISELYKEIVKISQEPPIPRLSIARLVARKSVEARQQSSPNPTIEPNNTVAAMLLTDNNIKDSLLKLQKEVKKITKRRQTVSHNITDINSEQRDYIDSFMAQKRRKIDEPIKQKTPEPYSFYGQTSEATKLDLSKIYTKVAIGGSLDTSLSIDKFKMLVPIDARVVVEKLNINDLKMSDKSVNNIADYSDYKHIKKACPASRKHKYV